MRPAVTEVAQFAHQAAFGVAQGLAEHLVPAIPHRLEQGGHVPLRNRLPQEIPVVGDTPKGLAKRTVTVLILQFPFDERREPRP
jgi:hypothetical protein